MTNLEPGMIFEDPDGYLFWVLHVDLKSNTVYVQDDSLHVLAPCLRVVRKYQICEELEKEFKIRCAHPNEINRFVGTNHLDTIPSPPNFDILISVEEYRTPPSGRRV